jgi:molecular chaperone DnaK
VGEASISVPELAGVSAETDLERTDFEEMLQKYVARTIELMHKAMLEAKVTADMVDHILLVGGSTLIPMVQDALRKEFGDRKIKKNIDPMLCVAFGAAMQTAMIDQIDCPNPECHDENGQQTKNPLEATECERCHTSLVGFDTVICPTCFLPNDANQPVCRKCKGRLDGKQESVAKSMTHASRPGTEQTEYWRCWSCDFPKNPASTQKCQICGSDREGGGVKCSKCGHLNPPGRDNCVNCGEIIGSILIDVTPEPIGVELEDGTLEVLIPKNAVYPTSVPTPYVKPFHTVEAGQRELEVIVRQGSFELAERDEYLGMVLVPLPPDLPRAAEVTVAMNLDGDGAGVVTVQLREYPTVRATARFMRVGTQSVETKRKRDELVQKAQALVKNGEDLPDSKGFGEQADKMKNEGKDLPNEDWDRFEQEVSRFEESVKANESVKSNLNMGKVVLVGAKDYMSTADKLTLERIINNIETAIARGQGDLARQYAQELEDFLNRKQGYLLLAQLEVVRVNGMVSARLADQIGAALRALKAAQSEAEVDRCLRELGGPIWEAVLKELGDRPVPGGRHKLAK